MVQIDYFLTPVSPFVYLAGSRLESIAAKHGATIRYLPLNAGALFPRTGGFVRADRHPSRLDYRDQELRRQAKKLAMPMDMKPRYDGTNPAPSSYAILAAQKAGGGDLGGLVQGFARAHWAEGRNIAEPVVVAEVMAAHGFDPAIADRGMMMAADAYGSNLEEAVLRGVFGVPFYMVGEEKFWGQDRLEDLDLFLAGAL